MAVFRSTRKILGIFINVRVDKWFNLPEHVRNVQYIKQQLDNLFTVEEANRSETFEQALQRLDISEEHLSSTDKYFSTFIALFTLLALSLTTYTIYLAFWNKESLASIMTFSLVLLCLSNAFRYHFWRFQLRSRKLGCSFRDWLSS